MITILGQNADVKVKELNDQHMTIVALFDKLQRAIIGNKSYELIEEILDQLLGYAESHFATEEKYFAKFDYPHREEHVGEHQEFIKMMLTLKDNIAHNELKTSVSLLQYLENWLFTHVAGSDKKYSAFFNQNGLH